MEDEHNSTDMVSRGPVQCLIALNLPTFATFSLYPFHFHTVTECVFLYAYQGFFRLLLYQLPQLLEDRFIVLFGRVNSCPPLVQPRLLVFRLAASPPASVPDSAFSDPPILSVVYPASPNWQCTPPFLV